MANDSINEKQKTPDELAQEKLEVLLDPAFDAYGVRFVNLDEYKMTLGTQSERVPPRHEISVFHKLPFTQYAQNKGVSWTWSQAADKQTEWDHASMNMQSYEGALKILRDAKRETMNVIQGDAKIAGLRGKVLDRFRSLFLHISGKGRRGLHRLRENQAVLHARVDLEKMPQCMNTLHSVLGSKAGTFGAYLSQEAENLAGKPAMITLANIPSQYLEGLDDTQKDQLTVAANFLWRTLRLAHSEGKGFRLISSFLQTPDAFDRGKLRAFFNAVGYSHSIMDKKDESEQYHVALVYPLRSIREDKFSHNNWGYIRPDHIHDFLGVIAAMPNKELWQELIELSKASGSLAHPVFDSLGNVRYPK